MADTEYRGPANHTDQTVQEVYRSLGQVWSALGSQTYGLSTEVQNLVKLCVETGLVDKSSATDFNKSVKPSYLTKLRDSAPPFIVIEGLDGTGKTTLTKFLSASLNMKLISTPPKDPVVQSARKYFDDQAEPIRRAFYSLGNYLAAQDVINSNVPVVMDRFWHSTAAYAMAHKIKDGFEPKPEEFIWPSDLLKPDLVIFLQVSEQERIRRHTGRKDFTNTEEEKTLAENKAFRKNLVDCYRRINGPKFLELNIDGEQPSAEGKILKTVVENFPGLESSENHKLTQA